MDTISGQMERFPASSEKSLQDMKDAEFHGEFENATYFYFWQLLGAQNQEYKISRPKSWDFLIFTN